MKVTGSSIQLLDRDSNGNKVPKSKCRHWRLWATTEEGRKSERFEGTWTQAQEALKRFVSHLEDTVPNSDTFGSYAESWRLWRAESGDFSPNTVSNDKRNVNALRRSELDAMRMDAVTPDACRRALLWIKANPVRADGRLSGASMAKIHGCLLSIMRQAHADGLIASNPMESVPQPKVDTPERDALSPMELQLLLNRVDELPLDGRTMALYFIICLGLRRAEACALLDSDVSGGFARIHLAVKEKSGEVLDPKSQAGYRTLPMPQRLSDKVREWREARKARGFFDAERLCCNTKGGLLRPQLLYRWWNGDSKHVGVRDSIGCQGITLHQLRHSNLSMMARHMSPFDLQRYAGWSSIEPAKVYIHDDLDAVSRAVSDAWGRIECGLDAPKTHQNDEQARA